MSPQGRWVSPAERQRPPRRRLQIHSCPRPTAGAGTVNLVGPDPAGRLAPGLGNVPEQAGSTHDSQPSHPSTPVAFRVTPSRPRLGPGFVRVRGSHSRQTGLGRAAQAALDARGLRPSER